MKLDTLWFPVDETLSWHTDRRTPAFKSNEGNFIRDISSLKFIIFPSWWRLWTGERASWLSCYLISRPPVLHGAPVTIMSHDICWPGLLATKLTSLSLLSGLSDPAPASLGWAVVSLITLLSFQLLLSSNKDNTSLWLWGQAVDQLKVLILHNTVIETILNVFVQWIPTMASVMLCTNTKHMIIYSTNIWLKHACTRSIYNM